MNWIGSKSERLWAARFIGMLLVAGILFALSELLSEGAYVYTQRIFLFVGIFCIGSDLGEGVYRIGTHARGKRALRRDKS